ALLDLDGSVLRCIAPGDRRLGRMGDSPRRIEAARSGQNIDLWTALVLGEVSVVARTLSGRRVYAVLENTPASRPLRALTKREIDILTMAARGLPNKVCAYALGLSETTVSSALARIALKVGVATRLELLRLAAVLTRDARASSDATELT